MNLTAAIAHLERMAATKAELAGAHRSSGHSRHVAKQMALDAKAIRTVLAAVKS